ncbi:MAG: tRNA uridine-5-carboxymethylaminomethyl(34) synthesis GTPase MnmE [Chlamydiae bacterium RIFCSPHIGHO2_12_FULL_27_8]|nr:MAG: tRNA uridine-5-carboxymethylaminomethyl(34) synthesis GTPase MnmE [Chlamydiae bacterium RIFCSPHIGHO2_12_FULL_27_8]
MTSYYQDTISAISTAFGKGAISIIRLSGKDSIEIANTFFSKNLSNLESNTLHFGKILDEEKNIIDTVMLSVLRGPNTYTGEDIIEINAHGGILITRKVFERVLKAGARQAKPGEFTLRAFLNKKIDLTQAEAIEELISANNEASLKAAKKNLEGALFQEIKNFQKELIDIAGILEAWVDFPEEDLEFKSFQDLENDIDQVLNKMQNLSQTYNDGKIIKEGLTLAIIGPPNVGKSSLLNTLLKKDRAIVTNIAGTTRDVLEEFITIRNLSYKIVDTAGIRKTNALIEKEGIARSKKVLKEADINILVLDSTKQINEEEKKLLKLLKNKKFIIAWNKIDLSKPLKEIKHDYIVEISAKQKINIEKLKDLIESISLNNPNIFEEDLLLTNQRHKNALDKAILHLKHVRENLQKISAEFLSFDMRLCLNSLNDIIGFDITEDILSSIFKNFCIGK